MDSNQCTSSTIHHTYHSWEKIIVAKSDRYQMQLVHLETTIDKLKTKHGDYFYVCTLTGSGCKQLDAQGGLRHIEKL
jgi:hypothetical protein